MKRHLLVNWLPNLDRIFGANRRIGNYPSWLCYMQHRAQMAASGRPASPASPLLCEAEKEQLEMAEDAAENEKQKKAVRIRERMEACLPGRIDPHVEPPESAGERLFRLQQSGGVRVGLTGTRFALSPSPENWDGHRGMRLDDVRLRRRRGEGESASPFDGGRSLGGSVCFLSLSDTCVGPMGAQLLREALARHEVSDVEVISAGTKSREGTPATAGAQGTVEGLVRHLSKCLEDFDLRQIAHIYCTTVALRSMLVQLKYPAAKVTVLHLSDPWPQKGRTPAEYGEFRNILWEETEKIAIRLKAWLAAG